jgi:hypothetical protein
MPLMVHSIWRAPAQQKHSRRVETPQASDKRVQYKTESKHATEHGDLLTVVPG